MSGKSTYKQKLARHGIEKLRELAKLEYQRHKEKRKALIYKWRDKDMAKHLARNRDYQRRKRLSDPDWDYAKSLKCRYGITIDDYYALLIKQGNACAVCRDPFPSDAKRRPVVDHCHKTNSVRGILCDLCNVMLGSARDSTSILESAVRYLARHSQQE